MRVDIVGRCGACGQGTVAVVETWPRCGVCGAWAASADLPIVPMVRERPPAPDRPAPFYKGLRVLEPPEAAAVAQCGTTKAPPGWFCTRDQHHDGPCAAEPLAPLAEYTAPEILIETEVRQRGCYIDSQGYERITETGAVNNCGLRNGQAEKDCQICSGVCPDRDRLRRQ